MKQDELIEIQDFDREYGLADLLPLDMAARLFGIFNGTIQFAIIFPDGSDYYNSGQKDYRWIGPDIDGIGKEEKDYLCRERDSEQILVFPLIHEMETIGCLVLQYQEHLSRKWLSKIGYFGRTSLERMIHLTYRNLLTSGLHGQVVQDSYQQLKKKADALQVSEAKYRTLAENLEVEVERKAEEIRETQLLMLQQDKLASIGQLAAGTAHEINNPIGFIISNLNSLKESISDISVLFNHYMEMIDQLKRSADEEIPGISMDEIDKILELQRSLDVEFLKDDMHALVSECLEGATRIKTIVQNLREFTHPSVDAQETVNLNDCLDTTLEILSCNIHEDIIILKDYAEIPDITCQLREINQVFFNIILNALQAMGTQGQLTIRTFTCDDDRIGVTIADSGAGIRQEHIGRVFDPFFTTRDVGSGTGLGLYLAYNIIKNHDGIIEVDSREDRGSEFTVKIPVVTG